MSSFVPKYQGDCHDPAPCRSVMQLQLAITTAARSYVPMDFRQIGSGTMPGGYGQLEDCSILSYPDLSAEPWMHEIPGLPACFRTSPHPRTGAGSLFRLARRSDGLYLIYDAKGSQLAEKSILVYDEAEELAILSGGDMVLNVLSEVLDSYELWDTIDLHTPSGLPSLSDSKVMSIIPELAGEDFYLRLGAYQRMIVHPPPAGARLIDIPEFFSVCELLIYRSARRSTSHIRGVGMHGEWEAPDCRDIPGQKEFNSLSRLDLYKWAEVTGPSDVSYADVIDVAVSKWTSMVAEDHCMLVLEAALDSVVFSLSLLKRTVLQPVAMDTLIQDTIVSFGILMCSNSFLPDRTKRPPTHSARLLACLVGNLQPPEPMKHYSFPSPSLRKLDVGIVKKLMARMPNVLSAAPHMGSHSHDNFFYKNPIIFLTKVSSSSSVTVIVDPGRNPLCLSPPVIRQDPKSVEYSVSHGRIEGLQINYDRGATRTHSLGGVKDSYWMRALPIEFLKSGEVSLEEVKDYAVSASIRPLLKAFPLHVSRGSEKHLSLTTAVRCMSKVAGYLPAEIWSEIFSFLLCEEPEVMEASSLDVVDSRGSGVWNVKASPCLSRSEVKRCSILLASGSRLDLDLSAVEDSPGMTRCPPASAGLRVDQRCVPYLLSVLLCSSFIPSGKTPPSPGVQRVSTFLKPLCGRREWKDQQCGIAISPIEAWDNRVRSLGSIEAASILACIYSIHGADTAPEGALPPLLMTRILCSILTSKISKGQVSFQSRNFCKDILRAATSLAPAAGRLARIGASWRY